MPLVLIHAMPIFDSRGRAYILSRHLMFSVHAVFMPRALVESGAVLGLFYSLRGYHSI